MTTDEMIECAPPSRCVGERKQPRPLGTRGRDGAAGELEGTPGSGTGSQRHFLSLLRCPGPEGGQQRPLFIPWREAPFFPRSCVLPCSEAWGAFSHTPGRQGQEWARCPRVAGVTRLPPLEPEPLPATWRRKGAVDTGVPHGGTSWLTPLGASSRKPSQIDPLASSRPRHHLRSARAGGVGYGGISVDPVGPGLCPRRCPLSSGLGHLWTSSSGVWAQKRSAVRLSDGTMRLSPLKAAVRPAPRCHRGPPAGLPPRADWIQKVPQARRPIEVLLGRHPLLPSLSG